MLVRDFGLPQVHAFYATWYRSYAIKKGLVTRDFAHAHAGEPAPAAPRRPPRSKPLPASLIALRALA